MMPLETIPPFGAMKELWSAEEQFPRQNDREIFCQAVLGALSATVSADQWTSAIETAVRTTRAFTRERKNL
jgi:hypothetical protein